MVLKNKTNGKKRESGRAGDEGTTCKTCQLI